MVVFRSGMPLSYIYVFVFLVGVRVALFGVGLSPCREASSDFFLREKTSDVSLEEKC